MLVQLGIAIQGLPVSACSAFFYVPSSRGGLGLRSVEDDLGSLMITQAVKMLTSPDPLVRSVVQHSLTLTVGKRYGDIEGLEDKWRFLASQIRCQREGCRGDVSTIWSRVQNFIADRQIRLHGRMDEDPMPTSISIGTRDFSGNFRKILLQELRKERAHFHHRQWLDAPKQGGLAQPLGCASESNYWLRDCRYLRYQEYHFCHQGSPEPLASRGTEKRVW